MKRVFGAPASGTACCSIVPGRRPVLLLQVADIDRRIAGCRAHSKTDFPAMQKAILEPTHVGCHGDFGLWTLGWGLYL